MLSSHDAKHGKHQEGDYQADGNDDKRLKPIPDHPGIPRQLIEIGTKQRSTPVR